MKLFATFFALAFGLVEIVLLPLDIFLKAMK